MIENKWVDPRTVPLPSVEELWHYFHYDPETGLLTAKTSRNTCRAGMEVGGKCLSGHRQFRFFKRQMFVHRVAWKMATGEEPVGQIDHINGIPDDNRLCNLRHTNHAGNMQNRTRPPSSAAFKNVRERNGKYVVTVSANGKKYNSKPFVALDEAVSHARQMREILHGQHARHD